MSLGQHSFELLTFILFANFVIFVNRHLAASFCVPLPPSYRHRNRFQRAGVYVPFFPQSGFGFSYTAVPYLEVYFRHRVFCN